MIIYNKLIFFPTCGNGVDERKSKQDAEAKEALAKKNAQQQRLLLKLSSAEKQHREDTRTLLELRAQMARDSSAMQSALDAARQATQDARDEIEELYVKEQDQALMLSASVKAAQTANRKLRDLETSHANKR